MTIVTNMNYYKLTDALRDLGAHYFFEQDYEKSIRYFEQFLRIKIELFEENNYEIANIL